MNTTPKSQIIALLSKLANEVATAESLNDMYSEDWNADGFLNAVHDLTEQLMNVSTELPDAQSNKKLRWMWNEKDQHLAASGDTLAYYFSENAASWSQRMPRFKLEIDGMFDSSIRERHYSELPAKLFELAQSRENV